MLKVVVVEVEGVFWLQVTGLKERNRENGQTTMVKANNKDVTSET